MDETSEGWTDRYCIVGAGPSGLLAARALKAAGFGYDQFERHNAAGGIWDPENPGSPMYESAHFISSKHTSGFFGFPMPDHFPDYPGHRQILSYVRDFAQAFGLVSAITFGVEVVRAEPLGLIASEGWRVTLSTGEVRRYAGIVCANGVTWHPNVPTYPGQARFQGEIRHTVTYRSADELKGKRVLIVGAGNSGVDIACDAARAADTAMISLRRGYRFVPKHVFGLPIDVFLAGETPLPAGVSLPSDVNGLLDALSGDLTRLGLPAPDHNALESHPILNTQILHHLAHGDIVARADVREFTDTGVVFKDGAEADIDLVLLATGYEYRLPFLDPDLFTWNAGHPELYLNIFHRAYQGLSVIGFVEFASAAYQRFDEIAQMIAMDAHIQRTGTDVERWTRMKAVDEPDLRGGIAYVDSPRHANYVNVGVYHETLMERMAAFDWQPPSQAAYERLRTRVATATKPRIQPRGFHHA